MRNPNRFFGIDPTIGALALFIVFLLAVCSIDAYSPNRTPTPKDSNGTRSHFTPFSEYRQGAKGY